MKKLKIFMALSIFFSNVMYNVVLAQSMDTPIYKDPASIPDTIRIPPKQNLSDTGETKLKGGALIDTVSHKKKYIINRPESDGKPDSVPKLK